MCGPEAEVYLMVGLVVRAVVGGGFHAAGLVSLGALVWAALRAQTLHPAALSRALPDLASGKARQAMRRVRRALGRAHLGSAALTPRLVRAALRLVDDAEALLVLDSTRCGRWEVFTLGVRWPGAGRVVPVAWSVLAYPWPKGEFTPTVVALLERTLRAWPADRALHVVADRGFPSLELFACLGRWRERLALGYTVRLRAGDYVWPLEADGAAGRAGPARRVGDWLGEAAAGGWTRRPVAPRRGKAAGPACWLVVGRGRPEPPPHQRGPADERRRAERAAAREAYLHRKRQPGALATDRVWALLTTADSSGAAVSAYAGRSSTENTYRDLHAWGLEDLAAREDTSARVDGLAGLAALAYLIQTALGSLAGRTADETARARQRQWSTTGRLSLAWRGRQVLHDPGADWRPWLKAALADLARRLAPGPAADQPRQEAA